MATGRANKLTGAVGEFLVAAELCRRDWLATPFAGNVPHYDIIASGQDGGHVPVQVKAIKGGAWQFDIRQFMEIELKGRRQVPGRKRRDPYPGLMCVLVALGHRAGDRFFVLRWRQLRDLVVRDYRRYLQKHRGVRPRTPDSFHCRLLPGDVMRYEGRWDVLAEGLSMNRRQEPHP